MIGYSIQNGRRSSSTGGLSVVDVDLAGRVRTLCGGKLEFRVKKLGENIPNLRNREPVLDLRSCSGAKLEKGLRCVCAQNSRLTNKRLRQRIESIIWRKNCQQLSQSGPGA